MRFTQHASNNKVLGAPTNWDQSLGECGALPVTIVHTENGPAMVSYWLPSDSDRKAIAGGAKLMLYVFGAVHPPVAVQVEDAA